ncbi:MAG: phenylacetate--CoA ligase family protein [Rubrivivax sp.]|nr:phenylacetate--CoA ligase family protein [Rubrivivax sp.]
MAADVLLTTRSPALAWRQRQRLRLQQLVEEAAQRSPWWRHRLRGFDRAAGSGGASACELMAGVPPLGKAELMANFDAAATDPRVSLAAARAFAQAAGGRACAYLGRYLAWESSGSSGVPALFLHDARSLAVCDSLQALRGPMAQAMPMPPWAAWPLGGPAGAAAGWPGTPRAASAPRAARVAFVGAVEGPFAGVLSLDRQRQLSPWVAASTRAFSFLQPLPQLVAELNGWQPTALATYPSMAWVLARAAAEDGLRLQLAGVWTGGETLGALCRQALQQAFGCTVRDTYGASECLEIASECAHGALHLHADWVVLEPVDAHGRAVPEGECADRVLLTNLANRVLPIVRYELGDRVRFVPGRCACGSALPMIEVQGRGDDVLSLAGAGGRKVHLAPLALTTVLEDEAGVFDFVVQQRGPRSLRVDLYGAAGCSKTARERTAAVLRHYLQHQGVPGARVDVRAAAALPARGRSGKRQRICRAMPAERGEELPP